MLIVLIPRRSRTNSAFSIWSYIVVNKYSIPRFVNTTNFTDQNGYKSIKKVGLFVFVDIWNNISDSPPSLRIAPGTPLRGSSINSRKICWEWKLLHTNNSFKYLFNSGILWFIDSSVGTANTAFCHNWSGILSGLEFKVTWSDLIEGSSSPYIADNSLCKFVKWAYRRHILHFSSPSLNDELMRSIENHKLRKCLP